MPDPDTGLDQANGAVQAGDATGNAGTTGSSEGDEPIVFGSFKTPEDAAKAFEDIQAQSRAFQAETDKTRAENKTLNETLLSKLTDAVTQNQQPQGPTRAEIEEQAKAWKKDYDENGNADMLYDFVSDAMAAARAGTLTEAEAEEKYGKKLAAMEQTLRSVTGQVASQDPEYLSVKEEYDGLAAKLPGTPRDTLMAFAKELRAAKGPSQPDRPDLPGGGGTQVVAAGGASGPIDFAAIEELSGMKLSDNTKQALQKRSA